MRRAFFILSAVSVLFLIAPAVGAGQLTVPLRVTEPVGVARVNAPVCGGVPVGPLKAKGVHQLFLRYAQGKEVQAQLSPMVTRKDGTLEWVLVDFLTDLKPNETKTFTLRKAMVGDRMPLRVKNGVTLAQTADTIALSNGLMKVQLSKKQFNLFDQVWLDRNGDGTFADDEAVLDMRRPVPAGAAAAGGGTIPALTLWRPKPNAIYATRYGKVEKVELEDAGPVRTTVRLDGTTSEGKGSQWLGWTCRVTMWAGNPNIRVLYAIRNVNPKVSEMAHIRRATITLKLAQSKGAANYVLGAGTPHMSRVSKSAKFVSKGSQWHRAVELDQVGPCEAVCSKSQRRFHHLVNYQDAGYRVRQFQPAGRKPIVAVGFKCDGWIDLQGDRGGCQLWLRNFTHNNPKRLEARADGTLLLDVIPKYDGDGQPYYANGGYWLGDRSHATYEMNVYFHPEPTVTAKDIEAWDRRFHNYAPIDTPAVKDLAANVERARHPLQLVSTPQWYTRCDALWGVMPSLDEERAAAKALGRSKVGPVHGRDASWLAIDFLHYENFHYRSEWDDPRDCIVEFLRTGDWDFYRRALSYARNYRDLGVLRTDGLALGSRARGTTNKTGAVPRWGKFCGCHNYGAGVIDIWLITGDRSYRDAGTDYGYDHARVLKVWGGFGGKGRGWGRKMASVLATYKITRDPKLKQWLVTNCRPPIPGNDVREDGRGLTAGAYHGCWMTALCHHAIWHNWLLHSNEYKGVEYDDYRDQLIGIGRNVAKYWWFDSVKGGPYYVTFPPIKPGDEQATRPTTNGGGGTYTATCIDMISRAYLLTGDKKLLAAAVKFWNGVNGADQTLLSARLQDILGMGSNTFWCRQLIYELAHPRQDRKPPAAVTDLEAEALGGGAVKLTWSAPADDGKVAAYQLKHAPCPMVPFDEYRAAHDYKKKWTWWGGYNVAGDPLPGTPGVEQSMTVKGVPAGTRYFALRSRDAALNESPISNMARVEVR